MRLSFSVRRRMIRRSIFILLMLASSTHSTYGQSVQRDLAYGSDAAQKLDLSVPAVKDFPVVIFVHGGSLTSGDKADSDYGRVCEPFPKVRIACANVNYRLGPEHMWPAQAEDVAAAVAWVRANIGARGGDPRKIFLLGHSSGATLVAVVGSDERYLAKYAMKLADLGGVMPMGSIMWDDDLEQAIAQHGRERVEQGWSRSPDNKIWPSFDVYRDHWPIRHVHVGMPPFLFLIAESEQEQPPVLKTDAKFVEEARNLGSEVAYRVLVGRKHYTAIRQLHEPGDAVFEIVRRFVAEHCKRLEK